MLEHIGDFDTMLIGVECARLLREKWVRGDPPQANCTEEAPEPPAESECQSENQQASLTEPN